MLVWLSTCILYQLNIVSDYAITQYRTNASDIAHLVRIVCSGYTAGRVFCLARRTHRTQAQHVHVVHVTLVSLTAERIPYMHGRAHIPHSSAAGCGSSHAPRRPFRFRRVASCRDESVWRRGGGIRRLCTHIYLLRLRTAAELAARR